MARRDVDQLRKLVEKEGKFKVVPSGSGHWKVLDAKGAVVVDENGPVIMSGTSSEIRGRDMAVGRLMKAGILKADPWAPDKGTDRSPAEERSQQEQERIDREMEARRREDQERAGRTHRIRERLEPIIVKLGGWDKRGLKTIVGEVAYYYAERMKLPDRWASASAATENADSIRLGATLSPAMASLWEHLLGELEAYPDTKVRFVQLQREAKKLDPPTIGEDDEPFTRSSPGLVLPTTPRPITIRGELPTLALRAMFEMGVGRPAHDPDRPHILKIGEEIMRLELQAREREDNE